MCSRMTVAWLSKSSAILRVMRIKPALTETNLRELPPPAHSEICRLYRAFAALLREICCISCHYLLPYVLCLLQFGWVIFCCNCLPRFLVPATRKVMRGTAFVTECAARAALSCAIVRPANQCVPSL